MLSTLGWLSLSIVACYFSIVFGYRQGRRNFSKLIHQHVKEGRTYEQAVVYEDLMSSGLNPRELDWE